MRAQDALYDREDAVRTHFCCVQAQHAAWSLSMARASLKRCAQTQEDAARKRRTLLASPTRQFHVTLSEGCSPLLILSYCVVVLGEQNVGLHVPHSDECKYSTLASLPL